MIKVLYAGSPDFSAYVLERLILGESRGSYVISGVLTNPPSLQGRHKELIDTPVACVARKYSRALFTPDKLDTMARNSIAPLMCDMLVCFAYGHIFGPKFLSLFGMGAINLHPSLLPKYRGATPIPNCIINMDNVTGVTVQHMALKADCGNIILQKEIPLDFGETTASLCKKAATLGSDMIEEVLQNANINGKLEAGKEQTGEASYCHTIQVSDGHIDWKESATLIFAKLRAYTPWPLLYSICKGQKLKLLSLQVIKCDTCSTSLENAAFGECICFDKKEGIIVKAGEDAIKILELQWAGKKVLSWKDFVNGTRDFLHTILQ